MLLFFSCCVVTAGFHIINMSLRIYINTVSDNAYVRLGLGTRLAKLSAKNYVKLPVIRICIIIDYIIYNLWYNYLFVTKDVELLYRFPWLRTPPPPPHTHTGSTIVLSYVNSHSLLGRAYIRFALKRIIERVRVSLKSEILYRKSEILSC